jgi:hypothetical protein
MAYVPQFTITPALLSEVEQVAALRERIQSAVVDLAWIPALQKDTRTRNVHASTAIEGNPLTLDQVRALEDGRELSAPVARPRREVLNYFAGLRFVEKNAAKKAIRHADILELHWILAGEVMDQGEAGKYRMIAVRVGQYLPPPADAVSGLMFELLEWWNTAAQKLSPVLSSAILHYRSHLFGGRILLGGSAEILCRAGWFAAGRRRPDLLAGILCGGTPADAGTDLAEDANLPSKVHGETDLAPAAGTASPSAPRSREHGPCRNMAGAWRVPPRRHGYIAAAS